MTGGYMLLWLTLACVSSSDMDSEATTAPDASVELSLADLLAQDCGVINHPAEVTREVTVTLVNSAEPIVLTPDPSWEESIAPASEPSEDWWMLELLGTAPSAPQGWTASLAPGESLVVQATAWILCIPELDADARPTGKFTAPEPGVYDTWPTWGPLSLWVEVEVTE